MTIYKGFADGLEELDSEIVSDLQIKTPVGRAYKKGTRVYADYRGIHFCSVGERMQTHLDLQVEFKKEAEGDGSKPLVYAGAAGLLNFSYMAAAKPAAALLYDINFMQKVFWDEALKGLAECGTVEEYKEFLADKTRKSIRERIKGNFNERAGFLNLFNLFSEPSEGIPYLDGRVNDVASFRHVEGSVKRWLSPGERPEHADRTWLEEGYDHLHNMAKNNAIGAVTIDVNDVPACEQLKAYLDQVRYTPVTLSDKGEVVADGPPAQGAAVDVLYISNLFGFISAGTDWTRRNLKNNDVSPENAWNNIRSLLSEDARVIDWQGFVDKNGPPPPRYSW